MGNEDHAETLVLLPDSWPTPTLLVGGCVRRFYSVGSAEPVFEPHSFDRD